MHTIHLVPCDTATIPPLDGLGHNQSDKFEI